MVQEKQTELEFYIEAFLKTNYKNKFVKRLCKLKKENYISEQNYKAIKQLYEIYKII